IAGARDGTGDGVRSGERLITRRFQRSAEGAGAVGQGAVAGQRGLAIAAGEMDGAGVARRRVVELILRRDGETEGRAGGGAGRSADSEMRGGGGADGDGIARAGDRTRNRVGGGERLIAGSFQDRKSTRLNSSH